MGLEKLKDFGEKAHDLTILFNVMGIDNYISKMCLKLSSNPLFFEFDDGERILIQAKKDDYNNILRSIMNNAEYFWDENQNKFGIVYADYEYRNELTEFIRNNDNPKNIKYFIIVAMNKREYGQKSYRAIFKDFDVNKVASIHGGGGHREAASVNITKEQKAQALVLSRKDGLKYLADCSYKM